MDLDHDAHYRAVAARDARFDGRVFVGVRTTGIYCRPICPARTPLSRNVTFFPTAAAAQSAGFRPCLRCRPESAPDLGIWRGTSNTVARGLALIGEGGLDGAAVEHLAERLGIGQRQLRRLFRQHLGASPLAVAQTQRVLFACQLIGQTRMPMGEIALAAGFGSVRRFNAIFQVLYGRAPRTLRRRRGEDAPAAAGIALSLPFSPPYDWPALLAFLASRAIDGLETVGGGTYHRALAIDGAQGSVSVACDETAGCLRVTIRFPHVTALAAVVAGVRRVFDLGADPVAIDAHLASDPALAPLVAARPGLRVPGAWDGFELATRAILGQQITVAAARTLACRMVAAHGDTLLAASPGLAHVFPAPETIAAADLTLLGMPASRARALSALARAVVSEPRLFATGQTLGAAIARLCALPGVGEWTAHYIAMRALREPDAFPAADIGLMRAMAQAGTRPNAAELLRRAEAWRPWRAYAAMHLWAADAAPAVRISPDAANLAA